MLPSNQPPINQAQPVAPKPVEPPAAKRRGGVMGVFLRLSPKVKIAVGLIFLAFLLLGIFLLVAATGVDRQLFGLSVAGRITTSENQAISGAMVEIEGVGQATTDQDGRYSFAQINPGTYDITIKADDYETLMDSVEVSGAFLSYLSVFDFSLQKSGFGSISGKFVADDEDYSFVNDRLFIDDQEVALDPEGTFALADFKSGLHVLEFRSDSFKDVQRQFELAQGQNPPFTDVVLEPAGDFTGNLSSYVREDLVLDLEIIVEGVSAQNISVENNGDFRVKDLEIGREYTVRTRKSGYESRDYKQAIEQGSNPIANFDVVEAGFVPFLAADPAGTGMQLFVANFDGENRTQLTSQQNMNPFGEYIDDSIVYFMSTRDRVRSSLGGFALLAYAASTEGGNAQRITTNSAGLGRIIPNLTARRIANVWAGSGNDNSRNRTLELMDLKGENRVEIQFIEEGTFDDVIISDNGAYVYYYMQNQSDSINGLYRANAQNGESTKLIEPFNPLLYDVSHDGDRVIYTASNVDNDLIELRVFTVSTGQDTRILQNVSGNIQFQFVGNSRSDVVFLSMRDSATNVYRINLDSTDQTKLTNFSGTEGVEAVYQQAGYILYQTNRGLYIMDPDKPVDKVLVTRDLARYTGYDF